MSPDAPGAPLVEAVLAEAGIALPEAAVGKLAEHAREMLLWNRSIRLTAVADPLQVAVKHIADSLFLLRFAPFPGLTMDFGSGAGYPGIPLAVALPEARLILVESSAKKCAFLSRVRSLLGLRNLEVVNARLEAQRPLAPGPFDAIVTRATVGPAEAATLLAPQLLPGGRLLLLAGPEQAGPGQGTRPRPAPRALTLSRGESFCLPRGMGQRRILEYRAA